MSETLNPEVGVLNQALDLPPEQRSAYLDRACAGNNALRKAVESLVAAHEKAEGFLAAPPTAVNDANPATIKLSLHSEEGPGTIVGRYKLLEKIGEGGFGIVYVAEQRE